MDIDAIEKRIRDAIAKVQSEGWTIASGSPDIGKKQCCVVVAMAIACGVMTTLLSETQQRLGIEEDIASGVANAFDGWFQYGGESDRYKEAYALGKKLRAEFIPGGA